MLQGPSSLEGAKISTENFPFFSFFFFLSANEIILWRKNIGQINFIATKVNDPVALISCYKHWARGQNIPDNTMARGQLIPFLEGRVQA